MEAFCRDGIYEDVDPENEKLLIESAPLMWRWAQDACRGKTSGGMEEWAKDHLAKDHLAKDHLEDPRSVEACGWYHGTWQFLRLLNMVATPPWYPFYSDALTAVLRAKPAADVLISAAADYGMLKTLHEAVVAAGARPSITVVDICRTSLLSCGFYAERFGFRITCVCDNLLTGTALSPASFDLIVTDELLTVLKAEYKPQIVKKWRELLRPGGTVVTTAMMGGTTTPELRRGYGTRARRLLGENPRRFEKAHATEEELTRRFDRFAEYHTRHMVVDEDEIRRLLAGFELSLSRVVTPGECVNPTTSFQIVASTANGRAAREEPPFRS